MDRTLFNQILDEILKLPVSIGAKRRQEIYNYIYELAIPDYRHGQRVLINEGNIADSVYFLLKGTCKFYYYSAYHEQELIPFLMSPPCLLAAGRCIYKSLPARFSIEVFEPSLVYKLSIAAIFEITKKYPELEPRVRFLIKQQNQAFKTWEKGLFLKTARERYLQLLDTSPDLIRKAMNRDIAKHLGIRDTSFSRLKRDL